MGVTELLDGLVVSALVLNLDVGDQLGVEGIEFPSGRLFELLGQFLDVDDMLGVYSLLVELGLMVVGAGAQDLPYIRVTSSILCSLPFSKPDSSCCAS